MIVWLRRSTSVPPTSCANKLGNNYPLAVRLKTLGVAMATCTTRDVQIFLAANKMAETEAETDFEVDTVRDWFVCCHRRKEVADAFVRHGYGSIDKIRTEMTEHDYNRIEVYECIPWIYVKRLQDIPEDNMPQELLVSVVHTS